VIWADANAPEWDGPIELFATAKIDGRDLKRVVKPFTHVSGEGNNSSREMREQYIGVHDSAPFSLSFSPDKITIEQGKKADVKLQLKRLWPEFVAKATIQSLMTPNNIQVKVVEIGDGKTEAIVSIEVNANAVPGVHTLVVSAQGQVPFQKDAKAPKGNQLVTMPSIPLTIEVVGVKK